MQTGNYGWGGRALAQGRATEGVQSVLGRTDMDNQPLWRGREEASDTSRPHLVAGEVISEAAPGDTYVACLTCGVRLWAIPTASDEPWTTLVPGAYVGE